MNKKDCESNNDVDYVNQDLSLTSSRLINVENKVSTTIFASINNDEKYLSRKPRWWRQLAGRRGTKSQRLASSRMSALGYCIPNIRRELNTNIDLMKLFKYPPRMPQKNIAEEVESENMVLEKKDEKIVQGKISKIEKGIQDTQDLTLNLEIGIGLGDNILANAQNNPHCFYIGADVHRPSVGMVLSRMEKSIVSGEYWSSGNDKLSEKNDISSNLTKVDTPLSLPYDNVRIYGGDGIKLLESLPYSSLSAIYITFPDPWPNDGQSKWRVIQTGTVESMARVLKPGGFVYLATDSQCFDEWTQRVFTIVDEENSSEQSNDECSVRHKWRQITPCPDRKSWLPVKSKYEEKGLAEGRRTMCQCWKLIS